MARKVSGLRFARSMLTPAANTVETAALDFDLGARLGIMILWVSGFLRILPAVLGADVAGSLSQSLHLETDALEDLPVAAAEDAANIDTEVFYLQDDTVISDFTTSGLGVFNGQAFQQDYRNRDGDSELVVARNITHRVEADGASLLGVGSILMAYKYVELSDAELIGVLTSRR